MSNVLGIHVIILTKETAHLNAFHLQFLKNVRVIHSLKCVMENYAIFITKPNIILLCYRKSKYFSKFKEKARKPKRSDESPNI